MQTTIVNKWYKDTDKEILFDTSGATYDIKKAVQDANKDIEKIMKARK